MCNLDSRQFYQLQMSYYCETRNIMYVPFSYAVLLHLYNQNCCQFCSEVHKINEY